MFCNVCTRPFKNRKGDPRCVTYFRGGVPGCVTKCDRGEGSQLAKNSVTYFMDGPSIILYSILLYSILFYSILFYSILFYSILFCSVLFCSILFCSILFCSILLCYIITNSNLL